MGRKRKSGMSHNKNVKTYKTTGRHLPPTPSTSQPQHGIKRFFCSTTSPNHDEVIQSK